MNVSVLLDFVSALKKKEGIYYNDSSQIQNNMSTFSIRDGKAHYCLCISQVSSPWRRWRWRGMCRVNVPTMPQWSRRTRKKRTSSLWRRERKRSQRWSRRKRRSLTHASNVCSTVCQRTWRRGTAQIRGLDVIDHLILWWSNVFESTLLPVSVSSGWRDTDRSQSLKLWPRAARTLMKAPGTQSVRRAARRKRRKRKKWMMRFAICSVYL